MRPLPFGWRVVWLALLCVLANGCASLGYYGQAVQGQWDLVRARRPLVAAMNDPTLPAQTRRKLALAARARDFASAQLALPARGSYAHYVALDRPYVVWNVFAAPPDNFALRSSCFLFVGCLDYRGFFDARDAQRAAEHWRARGDDVYVGGVAAYSTLGWFDDPLLSSMLRWDDATLIKTLFHELAHQRVYARHDTEFNEAFAMAVAEEGLRRWQLLFPLGSAAAGEAAREAAVIELALRYREKLTALYADEADSGVRARRKTETYAALRGEFERLAQNWPDRSAWAPWFEHDLNNAKLAAVAAYHRRVPQFNCLLARHGGHLPTFYSAVEALAEQSFSARRASLARACATLHNAEL